MAGRQAPLYRQQEGKGSRKSERVAVMRLAWWLCRHAAVPRRWVSQRLHLGDESRVTHTIRRVLGQGGAEVARLKERLERALLG